MRLPEYDRDLHSVWVCHVYRCPAMQVYAAHDHRGAIASSGIPCVFCTASIDPISGGVVHVIRCIDSNKDHGAFRGCLGLRLLPRFRNALDK